MRFNPDAVRALLFDVDGTLYSQPLLRGMMVLELISSACLHPVRTANSARTLQRFRRERENLRHVDCADGLELTQYSLVLKNHGGAEQELRDVVREWMGRRPLKYLRRVRYPGIEAFLQQCHQRGLRLGAYSDYPTAEKIDAMQLGRFFDLHLCSTDAEIDAFKPSPRGILKACELWGVNPEELLYVGDRPEIDGAAAEAAGCQFVLVNKKRAPKFFSVQNFHELSRAFVN